MCFVLDGDRVERRGFLLSGRVAGDDGGDRPMMWQTAVFRSNRTGDFRAFNSCSETLANSVTFQHHPDLGRCANLAHVVMVSEE
jgi:hypothetical protein